MCGRGITSVPSSEQFERDGLFYTVDEGSQSWWFWVLYRGQRDLFQFLEDVSPLTQEASSVLTIWKGVAGFETLCESVLTESLRTLVSSEFLQLPSESPWPAWLRTLVSSITQSFPFILLWQRHWNWWHWYHYSVIWWICNWADLSSEEEEEKVCIIRAFVCAGRGTDSGCSYRGGRGVCQSSAAAGTVCMSSVLCNYKW